MTIDIHKPANYLPTAEAQFIKKKCKFKGAYISVCDGEGEERFRLPGALTVRQAEQIMQLINSAFDKGVRWGLFSAAYDLADRLNIKPAALQDDL